MVESSITQASPISSQPGPRDVVAAYLHLTVDSPDLQQARLHLTKRSVESGDFEVRSMPAGSRYTMGAEEADELGRRIPVSLKRPADDGRTEEEMTVPMIVVEEEGQWKIDLPATMERLMGGVGGTMDKVAGMVGDALTTAMSGVGEALAEGLGGAEAAAKGVGRKAVKIEKAVKKAVTKAVTKAVAKAAKKALKKVARKKAKKAAPKARKATKKTVVRKTGKKVAKRTPGRKASKKRR
jgi:hypothetical protein